MPRPQDIELVEITGDLITETDLAYIVAFGDNEEDERVIPKLISTIESRTDEDVVVMMVPEWFAIKEGLV